MKITLSIPQPKLLVIAVAFLVAGSGALASPITVNQDVDLNGFFNSSFDQHYPDVPKVSVANGDDVTITFNFSAGNRLLVSNSTNTSANFATGWPWLETWGSSGQFTISSITISLLSPLTTGLSGTVISIPNQTDGEFHLGPLGYFDLGASSSVSFSGVSATYHVESVPGGANTYQPWIHGYFNDLSVSLIGDDSKLKEHPVREGPITADLQAVTVPDSASTIGLLAIAGILAWSVAKVAGSLRLARSKVRRTM